MDKFYRQENQGLLNQMYSMADILCERNKQIAELQARLDVTFEINNHLRDELQMLRFSVQNGTLLDGHEESQEEWEPDYEAEEEFERLMFGTP